VSKLSFGCFVVSAKQKQKRNAGKKKSSVKGGGAYLVIVIQNVTIRCGVTLHGMNLDRCCGRNRQRQNNYETTTNQCGHLHDELGQPMTYKNKKERKDEEEGFPCLGVLEKKKKKLVFFGF
jgi:hypothetical protein